MSAEVQDIQEDEVDRYTRSSSILEEEGEDTDIEILGERQGSITSPHSASEHSTHNNNATVPFENIDSSTKSREDCRLLTRMSEKNLTVGMYVKMRQLEYQNRDIKSPSLACKRGYYKRKQETTALDSEKILLERERFQLKLERAMMLERERKLLERERSQIVTVTSQIEPVIKECSSSRDSANDFKQVLTASSDVICFNPSHNNTYPATNSSPSPTVRDFLKNQLNIQRGKYQPPLRAFKQRKNLESDRPPLTDRESPLLDSLFAGRPFRTTYPPKIPHYMSTTLLPSTSADLINVEQHPDAPSTTTVQGTHLRRSIILPADFSSDDLAGRFSWNPPFSAKHKHEDEIEFLYHSSTSPPPTKIPNQALRGVPGGNRQRSLTADITKVQPLNLKEVFGRVNDTIVEYSRRQRSSKAIEPEITNVVPLDLANLLGNSEKAAPPPEVIDLSDDDDFPPRTERIQCAPEIIDVRPLDLTALLGNASNESFSTQSTNSDAEDPNTSRSDSISS